MDEQNNITWARTLEQAGVHVVYGIVGLKTHCKAALVVRREADGIRRYVHISTGNYNPTTARSYTDLGLFTAEPDVGEDVSALFNLLTGYADGYEWRKLLVAPLGPPGQIIALTERGQDAADLLAPDGDHVRDRGSRPAITRGRGDPAARARGQREGAGAAPRRHLPPARPRRG